MTLAEDRLGRAAAALAATVAGMGDEKRLLVLGVPDGGKLAKDLREYRAARGQVRRENRYRAAQATHRKERL